MNIKDAKSIFKKSSTTTRSSDTDTYWKLDENGNESRLIISDSDGTVQYLSISSILKLSDDILILRIEDEFIYFVDTKTEKLFYLPYDETSLYSEVAQFSRDDYGYENRIKVSDKYIYFISSSSQIIRLDPLDYTLQLVLLKNQYVETLGVTSEDFVMYSEKILCPGGRIVNTFEKSFILNNEIYSIAIAETDNIDLSRPISIWNKLDNNLSKEFVCNFNCNCKDVIINQFKNTAIIVTYYNGYYEFDGINEPIKINKLEGFDSYFFDYHHKTENSLYVYKDSELVRLDLATYDTEIIPTPDIELHNILSDINSTDLTFTGISYIEGKPIIGSITEEGEIKIEFVSSTENEIVNLIEL